MSDDAHWRDVAQLAELGVLTASLVHELRQPLFAIRAIAELLMDQGTDSADRIAEIMAQARYAERLIQHYGVLDNPETPSVLLDLNDPIRGAIDMVEHRARAANITLIVTLEDRPVLVRSRPSAIQQVATNVLVNALDAVEGQERREVHVRTERTPSHAVFTVSDTGGGIEPSVREHIFEPFVTSKPPGKGTGLGLAITRSLVRDDGGDVVITDHEDTQVRATWPLVTD